VDFKSRAVPSGAASVSINSMFSFRNQSIRRFTHYFGSVLAWQKVPRRMERGVTLHSALSKRTWGTTMHKLTAILAAGLITLFYSTAMAATYSALSSGDTQVAKAANTPYAVTMSGDATTGFKVDGSKVTILKAGDYFVIGAAQVGGSTTGNIYLWVRQNGKDVPDSNSIQNIPAPAFTTVLVSQGEMTFKAGDVLEFVYAASAPGLGLIATKPEGMPAVPSMIFSIFKN
jgi:hypothetical protein